MTIVGECVQLEEVEEDAERDEMDAGVYVPDVEVLVLKARAEITDMQLAARAPGCFGDVVINEKNVTPGGRERLASGLGPARDAQFAEDIEMRNSPPGEITPRVETVRFPMV